MTEINSLYKGFEQLLARGRGDNVRGRNLQALLLLNLCWSQSQMPLSNYRPKKNLAAFLALIMEVSDTLKQQTHSSTLNPDATLEQTLKSFLAELELEFPQLGNELSKMLTTVLLDEKRSTLPGFLNRLHLYLDPDDLGKVNHNIVIENLSLAEVFSYLGYMPPELGAGVERHPLGRDVRKALRADLDGVWSLLLENFEPSCLHFAACFPLNFMQLAERLPTPLPDFSFFYSLLTDGHIPGRTWQPPLAYLGDEQAIEPFRDLLLDADMKNSHLGLSSTLPKTIAIFDTWLELDDFHSLHRGQNWRYFLKQRSDAIRLTRLQFLARFEELRK